MAVLAVQQVSRAGLNPALAAAAAAGDAFPNTGRAFLRVRNAHATVARTVWRDRAAEAGVPPEVFWRQTPRETTVTLGALGAKLRGSPRSRSRCPESSGLRRADVWRASKRPPGPPDSRAGSHALRRPPAARRANVREDAA